MSPVLVLGTADWDQPIATNQHYVVRELAKTSRVLFTESMGLRKPELSVRDLRRAAARLGLHRGPSPEASHRGVPPGVDVRSPRILPRHVGLAARMNRPRIHRLVQDWIDGPGPRVLWTYSPVTYGLEQRADRVVYHCVDLLGRVEGISERLIDDAERNLGRGATVALGSSPVVVRHLEEIGFRDVRYWPNVADTDTIAAARPSHVERVPMRVVFAGNLSATKVDFDVLGDLVDAGLDVHLAGPISEGGGNAHRHVESIVARGATYHGMLEPARLAALYWTARVGLIPYVINEYTRGVSPLKTHEYLAAGLGVVSSPVPSVEPWLGNVEVRPAGAPFAQAVLALCSSDEDATTTRIRRAAQNSWTSRGVAARSLLNELHSL